MNRFAFWKDHSGCSVKNLLEGHQSGRGVWFWAEDHELSLGLLSLVCLANILVGHQGGGELRQIACRIFSFSANLILGSIGKEKEANCSPPGWGLVESTQCMAVEVSCGPNQCPGGKKGWGELVNSAQYGETPEKVVVIVRLLAAHCFSWCR